MKVRTADDNRFDKIEFDLVVVKWMVGFNLTATMTILLLLARH